MQLLEVLPQSSCLAYHYVVLWTLLVSLTLGGCSILNRIRALLIRLMMQFAWVRVRAQAILEDYPGREGRREHTLIYSTSSLGREIKWTNTTYWGLESKLDLRLHSMR